MLWKCVFGKHLYHSRVQVLCLLRTGVQMKYASRLADARRIHRAAARLRERTGHSMEMEFDVRVTAGVLYDYLLFHTYTSFSGMLGTLVGVFLIMAFLSTKYVIYLIAGAVIIAYLPGALFLRAAQQVQNTPAFRQPLHYRMTDEGISVSQGESEERQSWDSCVKAVSTGRSIILYTSRTTASIFPKRDLGDKKEALVQMISTHMPPKKVRIRF